MVKNYKNINSNVTRINTVKYAFTFSRDILCEHLKDIRKANIEARVLLMHILSFSLEELMLNQEFVLSHSDYERLIEYTSRRCLDEPIAYIVGNKEFYGQDFYVNKNTLIPRPDSEVLIDAVLKDYRHKDTNIIIEFGVGSGCIIITLVKNMNCAYGIGIEKSTRACKVAYRNILRHNVYDAIRIVSKDWNNCSEDFLLLNENYPNHNKIIVANPPYISIDDSHLVSKETLRYEPYEALFAEASGRKCYDNIASICNVFFRNSTIYLEIGLDMEDSITLIFINYGFDLVESYRDLKGRTRCLKFRYMK